MSKVSFFIVLAILSTIFTEVQAPTCYSCSSRTDMPCDIAVDSLDRVTSLVTCSQPCRMEYVPNSLGNDMVRSCGGPLEIPPAMTIPSSPLTYCERFEGHSHSCMCRMDFCNGLSYDQLIHLTNTISATHGTQFFTADEVKRIIKPPVSEMGNALRVLMFGGPSTRSSAMEGATDTGTGTVAVQDDAGSSVEIDDRLGGMPAAGGSPKPKKSTTTSETTPIPEPTESSGLSVGIIAAIAGASLVIIIGIACGVRQMLRARSRNDNRDVDMGSASGFSSQ